jgi:Ni2+-binding GTPase involved in maturation of urease and hydrogenase
VLGVNLMASSGAGKTGLIEQTIDALPDRLSLGVVASDITISLDADLWRRETSRSWPRVRRRSLTEN